MALNQIKFRARSVDVAANEDFEFPFESPGAGCVVRYVYQVRRFSREERRLSGTRERELQSAAQLQLQHATWDPLARQVHEGTGWNQPLRFTLTHGDEEIRCERATSSTGEVTLNGAGKCSVRWENPWMSFSNRKVSYEVVLIPSEHLELVRV